VALERLEEDATGALLYTCPKPWSDGTIGSQLSPLELLEKLAALVPLPRVHLVRYGGCLAPHSHLQGAIIPTPRQQGVEEPETSTEAPRLCPSSHTLSLCCPARGRQPPGCSRSSHAGGAGGCILKGTVAK
jgi:hypothetical protein